MQSRARLGTSNPLSEPVCAAGKVPNQQTALWQEPGAAIVQIGFCFESLESREWVAQVLAVAETRNGHLAGAADHGAQRFCVL